MKWTVKLVADAGQGEALEREIATIEREDQVSPASIGLTIAEGKRVRTLSACISTTDARRMLADRA